MRRLLHKYKMCVNEDVESILGARVPIIKFTDKATGEVLLLFHISQVSCPVSLQVTQQSLFFSMFATFGSLDVF